MKNHIILVSIVLFSLAFAAACGSSGPAAVAVTAPWDSMNLPIKERARVWGSTPTELKVVHPDDKPTVLSAYQMALIAAGWKPVGGKQEDGAAKVEFQKDGKSLELYIYDFEKTGAILTLK